MKILVKTSGRGKSRALHHYYDRETGLSVCGRVDSKWPEWEAVDDSGQWICWHCKQRKKPPATKAPKRKKTRREREFDRWQRFTGEPHPLAVTE
jgi:hypothetical protein